MSLLLFALLVIESQLSSACQLVAGIDSQLVPAVQFALQKGGMMVLTDVAILSSVQMVLTNLAAPFWGGIADRGLFYQEETCQQSECLQMPTM